MIPLLLSLTFGTAIYLIFMGLTAPPPSPAPARRMRAFEEFLVRAGVRGVTPKDFLLFSAGGGLLVGVFAQVLLGWVLVSLIAAGLGAALPLVYFAQRHDRRRAAVQVALADAAGQLRDSIRAGLSVQEAFTGLARSGPEALRPEFGTLVREARLVGFAPALTAMRERLADPLFDVIAVSLLLNDRLGGRNVGQVLDRLAAAMRAQLRVQDELRAYQARNVLSARIIAAVPLAVLIGIRQVNPDYLALFDEWLGQLLLAGCLASIAVGYAGMRWLTRLPGERRVLR
jgi:tight adherence protein B